MPTIIPALRCPTLGSGLFSMMCTGMLFLSKVRANISPVGPAPTYATHWKLPVIDQNKLRTIKTWGGVATDICDDMMEDI